jgi:hypothetical protein
MECPLLSPNPSPIRRIIDHSFALTKALNRNGWGLLLMLSVAAQSQGIRWQSGWQCRLGEMMAEQPKAPAPMRRHRAAARSQGRAGLSKKNSMPAEVDTGCNLGNGAVIVAGYFETSWSAHMATYRSRRSLRVAASTPSAGTSEIGAV